MIFRNLGIGQKLISVMGTLIAIPLILIGYYSYKMSYDSALEAGESNNVEKDL